MPQIGDKLKDIYGSGDIYKVISVRKNHYRVKVISQHEPHRYYSMHKENVHEGLKGGTLKLLTDGVERAIRRLKKL